MVGPEGEVGSEPGDMVVKGEVPGGHLDVTPSSLLQIQIQRSLQYF